MTQIILTGDSHLGALKRAVMADTSGQFANVTFWPLGRGGLAVTEFFHHDKSARKVTITAEEWAKPIFSNEEVAKLGERVLIAVSLPVNSSRILREYSWINHVPWRFKQGVAEMALSDAVLEAIFDQDSRNALAFVAALSEIGLDVVVVEGPRFFASSPHLKQTRFEVATGIEDSYRAHVRRRLSQLGIASIAQPTETVAADGCTKTSFHHENPKDPHHANAAFGLLMLNDIQRHADARFGAGR